jgi:hypothetical protein
MNELAVRESDMPAIADDYLIQIADQAEKRIDAVIKIKQVALKVTNARDWTDQQGNPYLQVSGSEKIANLFNISWRIEEPKCEDEPDGHFTYSIKGEFSLGGRTIEVEGTRSSKDGFFTRYDYDKPKVDNKNVKLPPSSIDRGDVKKAALTNLYGNGITRMLGIRNLTWDDLEKYAGITQKMVVGKVSYNQREEKDIKPPQAKNKKQPEGETREKVSADGSITITATIEEISSKSGEKNKKKWTLYGIKADGQWYNTFDQKLADDAKEALHHKVELAYIQTEKSKNLTKITMLEQSDPKCTQDPTTCDRSTFDQEDKAFCDYDPDTLAGTICKFQKVENA